MRVIATLVGLVFAATVVAAQDALEPPPQPVYPLCDMAFAAAPASGFTADAEADPSVDPGPTSPGDQPSPGSVEPAAVATPPPSIGLVTFLDDAIKSCSGVGEFVAASAIYPDVLGATDPVAFLTARCRNPGAGLNHYATCTSLERALATPTPEPIPTPTAEVVEELARPQAEPRSTAKKPKSTPRPTARPASPKASEPRIRMKQVPSHIRAAVPGATRVHYFAVKGKTPQQLTRSMTAQAGKYCASHRAAACMETVGEERIRPTFVQDPYTGACTITGVRMPLTYVAHIPRWTAPSRVPVYMVWWWKKAAARIGWHEAQHVRIAKEHAARLPKLVVGKPCGKYNRLAKRWFRSLTRAQHAFDELDYPRSERLMNQWWERAYRRFLR